MSGNIEITKNEIKEFLTPVTAAALTSAYFAARSLPENRESDPEKVLAQVIEVFKACYFEAKALGEAA